MLAGIAILLAVCGFSLPCGHPCDIQVNQAAKNVISSFDALVDLLEFIEQSLCRLDIYMRIPSSPTMNEISGQDNDRVAFHARTGDQRS